MIFLNDVYNVVDVGLGKNLKRFRINLKKKSQYKISKSSKKAPKKLRLR